MTSKPLFPVPPMQRLHLDSVTMCAVSSSNIAATVQALETSLLYIDVAEAILFTDADLAAVDVTLSKRIRLVRIDPLTSSQAYSDFILNQLVDYIATSHCLIVQWDGHVIDPARWRAEFLDYDYIGGSWPQFDDGHDVGNGGFSLRSRALMAACRTAEFKQHHPEDVAICRTNRCMLECQGLSFAPAELADEFSAERAGDPSKTFGYHGVFLMPRVLGADGFWMIYTNLTEYTSLRRDFRTLLLSLLVGHSRIRRLLTMVSDQCAQVLLKRG